MRRSLAPFLLSLAAATDVILPSTKSGENAAALVLVGSSYFEPEFYEGLGRAIQEASSSQLWVGIPDLSAASTVEAGVREVIASLVDAGMPSSADTVLCGHGNGGVSTEAIAFNSSSTDGMVVAASVLLGSFIPRSHYSTSTNFTVSSTATYPVPTLTIGGDLDGVARVTRVGMESYFQQITLADDATIAAKDFPVVVIEGLSHVQFANGSASDESVLQNDLKPELSNSEATAAVATAVADFLAVQLQAELLAQPQLQHLSQLVSSTADLLAPLVAAFQMEGTKHFYGPCNSDWPTNPDCAYTKWPDSSLPPGPVPAPSPLPVKDCTCGAPWIMDEAQKLMAGFDVSDHPSASSTTADAFHDVSDTHPFHLPHIFNSCSEGDADCVLNTTTVTMPMNEDADTEDDGFAPLSVVEFRTKLKSRQAMWQAVGLTVDNVDDTDAVDLNLCAGINQASLEWALSTASDTALRRYRAQGEAMTIGSDMEAPIGATGPTWIAKRLSYERVNATNSSGVASTAVEVSSWSFIISNYNGGDVPYYITAGYHYCKVLSPARALEWIYVDSLRRYNSAASSADVDDSCNACLEKLDPVHLSKSSSWCWIDETCYTVGDSSNPCTENQCASQASLSECICDSCSAVTCSL